MRFLDVYTPRMAGPPTAAFSQLTVRYTGVGLPFPAVTTHGFTTSSSPIGDVTDAIATFGDELAQAISTFVTVDSILWKVGPVATGQSVVVGVNHPGEVVGGMAPANTAALVTLSLADVSGRFHGRFYLPGMVEFGIDDSSNLTTDHQTTIQAAVATAYAAVSLVGMEPVVFSSVSSDPTAVEAVLTQRRVSTQRRRMRR